MSGGNLFAAGAGKAVGNAHVGDDLGDQIAQVAGQTRGLPRRLFELLQPGAQLGVVGRTRGGVFRALQAFAECLAKFEPKDWPGYGDDVTTVNIPPWLDRQLNGFSAPL